MARNHFDRFPDAGALARGIEAGEPRGGRASVSLALLGGVLLGLALVATAFVVQRGAPPGGGAVVPARSTAPAPSPPASPATARSRFFYVAGQQSDSIRLFTLDPVTRAPRA